MTVLSIIWCWSIRRRRTSEKRSVSNTATGCRKSESHELWSVLHRSKLISDEKYSRLMSRTPFTEKQMGDFIARQLVETSQGTKGVAELLKQLMSGMGTEVVYAKASNVSDFRNKNGFY